MREILFRGYSTAHRKWFYGDLSHCLNSLHISNDESFVAVSKKSVGQYTGLTDKNGKKIFEGDIVDCWSEGVNAQGTVQQRRDGLWIIYPAWQKHIMWGLCPDEYSHTSVEVIGNIYDNPELIGSGEYNG